MESNFVRLAVAFLLLIALVAGAYAAPASAETPTMPAAPPDLSKLPPHPRLYIGGLKDAPGYIDPATLGERIKTHAAQFAAMSEAGSVRERALTAMASGDAEGFRKVVEALRAAKATSGNALTDIALAFDWIACDLPEADRKAIAKHVGDLAEAQMDSVGGRFNAFDNNPLRRDMGVGLAALAIAGDDDRAQKLLEIPYALFSEFMALTGDRIKETDLAGRGMYGGGWPEGLDYDRHGSRYAMTFFLGLRSATGIDVFTGSKFWKDKIPYYIYTVLPNGYSVLPFQDVDNGFIHRFDRELMLVMARQFDDPHARWYLNHVNDKIESTSGAFEFLFAEPGAAEHDYSDLPRAHYVPGTGQVIARSGWGPNDTYLAFTASDWYVYHQNNAQNVFAIYRNAPLAVKDGVYDGDMHWQYVNYAIRTIAYNGITVFDPAEQFRGPDGNEEAANDGGQMIQQWKGNPDTLAQWREQARRSRPPMRDIADWLAFESTDTYAYMAGEAGRAYTPGKVPYFSRQVLFVYPNWVVVFDRVTSGDASFVKKFHLHAPEEMAVSGSGATITTRKTNHTTIPGRLFVQSLLPKDAALERIEGIATYNGKSWVGPKEPYGEQVYCPYHLNIVAPIEKDTIFLTAMYACDADVEKAPEARIVEETPDKVTLSLEGKWKVTFSKTGEAGWKMEK